MMTLACKDMGMDCKFVAKGMDWDDMMSNPKTGMKMHAMKVHKMTEADMTPDMMAKMKSMAKMA